MKGTEHFKQTVKAYLDGRAQTDELFAVSYAKENKNLDDCITFILNQVKASGCCGMTDDEVWSLAVHYYDEDNIDVGKPISCGVVVNHKVELTEEEKVQARKDALKAYQEEELRKIQQRRSRPKPAAKTQANPSERSLFDFEYESTDEIPTPGSSRQRAVTAYHGAADRMGVPAYRRTFRFQSAERTDDLPRLRA